MRSFAFFAFLALAFSAAAVLAKRMTAEDFDSTDRLPVKFESRRVDRLVREIKGYDDRVASEIVEAVAKRKGDTLYKLVQCPICLDCMHSDTLEITTCGHAMHRKCLKLSVREVGDSCPICRREKPRPVATGLSVLRDALLPSSWLDGPLKKMLILFEEEGWIPPRPGAVVPSAPPMEDQGWFYPSPVVPSKPPLVEALDVAPRKTFGDFAADRIKAHIDLAEEVLRDVADALTSPEAAPARGSGPFPLRPTVSAVWTYQRGWLDHRPSDCFEWLASNVPGFRDLKKLDRVPPKDVLCALLPMRGTTQQAAYRARERFMDWVLSTTRTRAKAIVPGRTAIPEVRLAERLEELEQPSGWFSSATILGPEDVARAASPWLAALARELCDGLRDELRYNTPPSSLRTSSSRWLQRVDDLAEVLRTVVYSTVAEYSFSFYKYNDHLELLHSVISNPPRSDERFRADYPSSNGRKLVSVENARADSL